MFPILLCVPFPGGSLSESLVFLATPEDLWLFGRRAPRRCCSTDGNYPLIECIDYLVSKFVADILLIRMSPLLVEMAFAIRASLKHTRPAQERASIWMDVLR